MDWQALSETARAWWVVWLMILFLGVAWWAFRPQNKERFERDGEIPLRDDKDGDQAWPSSTGTRSPASKPPGTNGTASAS